MKSISTSRALWRTPGGVITILTTIGVIGHIVWVFSGFYTLSLNTVILAKAGIALISLLAAVCAGVIVVQPAYGRVLRLAWLLLGMGVLSRALANGLIAYYQVISDFPGFPGTADILQLSYYPLTLTGLMVLPFIFVPSKQRMILWLDLVMLFTFSGTLAWALLSGQAINGSGEPWLRVWFLSYPIGDLLILSSAIALAQRDDLSRAARQIMNYIALAMAIAALGDMIYTLKELSVRSNLEEMPYLFSLWLVSAQVYLIAAVRQHTAGPEILNDPQARFSSWRHYFRLALPYTIVIAGVGLLLAAIQTESTVSGFLVGLVYWVIGLVGIVLLRQFLVSQKNLRMYQRMRRVAWTDSLTGLYNRHFFNEMLPREIERASRYNKDLSLLLFDVDKLKHVNDTYGHIQGDQVLKVLAHLFLDQLRAADTIARFGGDEFVIILPETNRRRARVIADRICKAVEEQNQLEITLSTSVGIGVYRAGLTPEELLEEADRELYKHKHANNNQPVDTGVTLYLEKPAQI